MKFKDDPLKAGGIAARQKTGPLWYFLPKSDGAFLAPFADYISRLYFPLLNRHGMKCSVTPELKGDIAMDFQHFLTPATVTEELHRNVSGRNFWIKVKNKNPWSATGNSVYQKASKWTDQRDESEVEGHIGAFIVRRKNKQLGLESEITVFVPDTDDYVELMKVRVRNTSDKPTTFTATSAIPIFGRHADNFRDHRQVTTMFQKVFVEDHGVRVKPTIVHDEHGHAENKVNYSVLGFELNGAAPKEIWPLMKDFAGEGGSMDNPESVFHNLPAPHRTPEEINGREAIGALRFMDKTLAPGESADYIIIHGISELNDTQLWKEKFGNARKFDLNLEKTFKYWNEVTNAVSFETADKNFDYWIKWIAFQVKCRQIFGNSYLPDFGYGRGGRGWRDLWQDLLSIFLVDPDSAREEILNNFRGIRVDGSNATIIGTKPGEFIADRNNVPRTWCDHGAWPAFVLNFYIHQSGDFEILFKELPYWKDVFTHRSKGKDSYWDDSQGYLQKDKNGNVYTGSVIEHILLQQLTAFFNVGSNNNLLLEGGDWNDTLDMARDKGESVCFHNFYGHNLSQIAKILEHLKKNGYHTIKLLSDVLILLDRLPGQSKVNYDSPDEKQKRLKSYFQTVDHQVSRDKTMVSITDLIIDLREKAKHTIEHIRSNEWIETSKGHKFFNGHYDNKGIRVHGDSEMGVQMDLTSQVLPVLCNTADSSQIKELYRATRYILKEPDAPGLRLCTDFKQLNLNIGRITGFTYGFKEHGSKWSQQNIMFLFGLYQRGFVTEGFEIFKDIFKLCNDSQKSLIFPGVPSYFEPGDRGAYAYLTASPTWLLLTLTSQIFGVDGYFGDLVLNPKLDASFFDENNQAIIHLNFRNLRLKIVFANENRLSFPDYYIGHVTINQREIDRVIQNENGVLINHETLLKFSNAGNCVIKVELVAARQS